MPLKPWTIVTSLRPGLLSLLVLLAVVGFGKVADAAAGDTYDPVTNSTLKAQDARFAAGWNNDRAPIEDADGKGLCKLYAAGGGVSSGCVNKGVFTLYMPGGQEVGGQIVVDSTGAVAATKAEQAGTAGAPDPRPESCDFANLDICVRDGFTWAVSAAVGGVAYVVLAIASFVLWIVGGMFNWVVIKTVFEFGSTFGTSKGMLIAWGILRDIGNIVLLFSFIFMGIATILNTHALDEYSARKALPRLIIFAVLLNFSLFAAQIVIDTSNSLAAVFTAQAGDLGCTGSNDTIDARKGAAGREACANNGIAGQVIQMAGISSVWTTTSLGEFMSQPQKHAPVYIGLAIFVTITAVVLLAAAIMLVFRAVMLCLLMVLSPIGFAGMAIPPLQEFANDWWKKLISNAFFAPIYLLLVFISLKIVDGLVRPNDGGSFAKAMIEGSTNAPQIFVIFAVVITFMIAALTMARSMGAAGADFAIKTAGGAVFGTQGFIARRTVGRGSAALATRIQNSAWAQRNPNTARFAYGILNKGATASLSPRGLATQLGKGAHLDFGKPNKTASHGFHGIEEKAAKEREEFEKKLRPTDKQKAVATIIEQELGDVKKKLEENRAEELARVEEKRLKLAEARLGTDEEALELARREFDNALRTYNTKNSGTELEKRRKDLEKQLSAWKARADQLKRETYLNEGLDGNWYPPGSVGAHADHEAAANIRKNAGKSKLDKTFEDLKKNLKDESGEGAGEEAEHGGGGNQEGGGPAGGAAH